MSLNVFVSGLSGRMGKEIQKIVHQASDLNLAGGLSKEGLQGIESAEVIIDFSLPEALDQVIELSKSHKLPLVCGTTGLDESQFSQLKSLSSDVPVFWASNMSLGIYLMKNMVELLAKAKGYDFHISETHHTQKIDKPSGTAITLEKAAESVGATLKPTTSLRQGEVFGIHTFEASNSNEKIQICHEALDRGLFAQGAIDVARWLVSQKPSYYGMADFFPL